MVVHNYLQALLGMVHRGVKMKICTRPKLLPLATGSTNQPWPLIAEDVVAIGQTGVPHMLGTVPTATILSANMMADKIPLLHEPITMYLYKEGMETIT